MAAWNISASFFQWPCNDVPLVDQKKAKTLQLQKNIKTELDMSH